MTTTKKIILMSLAVAVIITVAILVPPTAPAMVAAGAGISLIIGQEILKLAVNKLFTRTTSNDTGNDTPAQEEHEERDHFVFVKHVHFEETTASGRHLESDTDSRLETDCAPSECNTARKHKLTSILKP